MGVKQVSLLISCVTHCVLFDFFQAIHTQGFISTSQQKVHKLNSIVPLAYARFTILIILLLPHHHQCIASVYSISICRGGLFSTAEHGICWTPKFGPLLLHEQAIVLSPLQHHPAALVRATFRSHVWHSSEFHKFGPPAPPWTSHSAFHSPAIVLSTLQP